MTQGSHDLFADANLSPDKVVGKKTASPTKSDRGVVSDEEIRQLCLRLWPEKGVPALRIAMHSGCDIRSAQRIMARQQGFSREVFNALAASDVGQPFLKLFMSKSTAKWWTETYEDLEIAAMEKRARDLLREVKKRREVD